MSPVKSLALLSEPCWLANLWGLLNSVLRVTGPCRAALREMSVSYERRACVGVIHAPKKPPAFNGNSSLPLTNHYTAQTDVCKTVNCNCRCILCTAVARQRYTSQPWPVEKERRKQNGCKKYQPSFFHFFSGATQSVPNGRLVGWLTPIHSPVHY